MSEELKSLAYRKLEAVLGPRLTDLSVWLNKDYGEPTRHQIEDYQNRIDRIRSWATELPNSSARSAYLEWLDGYYQRGLNDALREFTTEKLRREHRQHDLDHEARENRIRALGDQNALPDPPRS